MDPEMRNRLIAGAVLALVIIVGVVVGTHTSEAGQARADELMARERSAAETREAALAREFNFSKLESVFGSELIRDQEVRGLRPLELAELKEPNELDAVVTDGKKIDPGGLIAGKHAQVRVNTMPITTERSGVTVTRPHTVAIVENTGTRPIAYRLLARSERECAMRGAHRHNAMALMPGEQATIAICGGEVAVVVDDFRTLTLTPIGYFYLSMVPPGAVGYDAVTARSHEPPREATVCSTVATVRIAARLDQGELAWEDVVDFFSRHNCERHDLPEGYRRATTPVEHLPHTAPG